MTPCRDMDVIHLTLTMALSYSKLCQNRSLDYLNKALYLCHKIFGEHNINFVETLHLIVTKYKV